MPPKKTTLGIIGCGNISSIYFKTALTSPNLQLLAAADLDLSRAQSRIEESKQKTASGEYKNVPATVTDNLQALSVPDLLARKDIDLVLNLTVPLAHADIALQTLHAGKHAYAEKPLATTRDDGRKIISLAAEKKLRVGCAPDTFLGGAHQTCRKIIDDGWIGRPLAATAFMTCPGHESWHPSPEFYYQPGGGPMFDMGPYYLTALVNLLGPANRVAGFAKASYPTRRITSLAKHGTLINVETPTHFSTSIEFASGTLATLIMSFDIWRADLPRIEIYGSEGTLSVPDPNNFGGTVKVARRRGEFKEFPLTHANIENSRGIGVADMAAAIASGRAHRASGVLAYHVLDIMQASLEAQSTGKTIDLITSCDRPPMLPPGLDDGQTD